MSEQIVVATCPTCQRVLALVPAVSPSSEELTRRQIEDSKSLGERPCARCDQGTGGSQ